MKPKKIVLIIISAILCLALIFGGIVILSGRNKKKNEKTDGQEKTESTIWKSPDEKSSFDWRG